LPEEERATYGWLTWNLEEEGLVVDLLIQMPRVNRTIMIDDFSLIYWSLLLRIMLGAANTFEETIDAMEKTHN